MRSAITDRGPNTSARTWTLAGASAVGSLMLVVACGDELTQPSDANPPAEPNSPTGMAIAIDSVSPRASEAGETVELRILGTGFEDGTTARVEHGGAPSTTVVAEKTDFMNEGELHVVLGIGADATPALYDIIVSNPDGTRAVAGGIFTVNLAVPIIVSEAEPSEAAQGETRTIRILGSGFLEGDEVAWERGGVVEENVVVGQVEFVSSAELSVTIEVQDEAPVANYDVAVTRPRKKGIGTEAFAVLPGIGSVLQAQFSFTYDGYRSDSFEVDDTFILDPETMDPGSWGLTHFSYEASEQGLFSHHLRDDGLVDMMWCWVPGVRVREPGTHALDCWFIPQYNFETGEFADPEDYTSFHGGDRPGDGSGIVTFTSVTPERLAGTFSITMHVVDWEDWLSSPSITISDGKFDLPVVSSYWDEVEEGDESDPPDSPTGSGSRAIAINDQGTVAGVAINDAGEERAVRWTVTSEGTVDGPEALVSFNGSTIQIPTDINNEGMIVGFGFSDLMYWSDQAPFIYDGSMHALTPPDNSLKGGAFGINDQGVVVGQAYFSAPNAPTDLRGPVWLHPFDSGELPIQLPPLHPDAPVTHGEMINDLGDVVGYTTRGSGHETGYVRWLIAADGTVSEPEPINLSVADINDDGDLVGYHPTTNQTTLLRDNSYIGLDPLPGHAAATVRRVSSPLNGQPVHVVGFSSPGPNNEAKAVVWNIDAGGGVTGPTELGLPEGYSTSWASDINAHGWIVGLVYNEDYFDGVATLWLPQASGAGYDIITLGTLAEPAGTGSIVFSAPSPCRPRPGRPDGSISCR